MKRFLPRLLTAFLSAAILPAVLSSVMAQDPCKLTDIGTGTVASVRDGRTLMLADGRELRLAAIEVADDSRGARQSLVGGRDLRLKQLSPERNRYGRIVAFAYVGNSEQSVQQALLEQGRARVSARTGSKACADLLLRNERGARAGTPRPVGRPQFCPFAVRKSGPDCGCAGAICTDRRQGLVGAGKRRHNIFELRAALDTRFYSHHPQASSAGIRHGRPRSETVGGQSNPGAGLDWTAKRPGDRSREP